MRHNSPQTMLRAYCNTSFSLPGTLRDVKRGELQPQHAFRSNYTKKIPSARGKANKQHAMLTPTRRWSRLDFVNSDDTMFGSTFTFTCTWLCVCIRSHFLTQTTYETPYIVSSYGNCGYIVAVGHTAVTAQCTMLSLCFPNAFGEWPWWL